MSKAAVWRSRAAGIAYALFAVVLGFTALVVGQMTYMVRTDGVETSATVVETDVGLRSDDNALVEFRTDDGLSVRTTVAQKEVGDPDVGDIVRIRYAKDDPETVTGTGTSALLLDILYTVTFALAAISSMVKAYRRIRLRTRSAPAPQRISGDSGDHAPARVADTARDGTVPRPGKAIVALSLAGLALITYRRLSRRRPK